MRLCPAAAVAIALLLTSHSTAAPPKADKSRTVCAPVSKIGYDVLFRDFGGLTVDLWVEEGDARWPDHHTRLPSTFLFIEGKPASPSEIARWATTAIKPGEAWRAFPAELVEVTVVFDPNVYGGVRRADFRAVPWAKHYPLDEVRAQLTFFFRRWGIEIDAVYNTMANLFRSAPRAPR